MVDLGTTSDPSGESAEIETVRLLERPVLATAALLSVALDTIPPVRTRLSGRRWLVAVGTLICAAAIFVVPVQAYTAKPSPWAICAVEMSSNEIVEEHTTLLNPSDGAMVVAGTAVAFSGESGFESPLTFNVASSPALLSSPDIDSGLGSLQSGATYAFVSTKASAIPRTIYWDASFTRVLHGCEGPPVSFTTTVRSLVVGPSAAEQEAAANRRHEEEAAAKRLEEASATDSVRLDGVAIGVLGRGDAAIKLTCTGTTACAGTLTLTASGTIGKRKKDHPKNVVIGAADFSIAACSSATIRVRLNGIGRTLLSAAHGHLHAALTILKTSRVPSRTRHSVSVRSPPR